MFINTAKSSNLFEVIAKYLINHRNLYKCNISINKMNKWSEILLGLILIIGMILIGFYSSANAWAIAGKSLNFWRAGWEFLKGGVFWFVILIGLLFLMLGISDLKE